MKPLDWSDRFFLLGKAIILADRPEYETTVAGFCNDTQLVTLHHGNAQSMKGLAENYRIFFNNEWTYICLKQFLVRFRYFSDGDYFKPLLEIPIQQSYHHAIDRADAINRFYEYYKDMKGNLEVQSVEEAG